MILSHKGRGKLRFLVTFGIITGDFSTLKTNLSAVPIYASETQARPVAARAAVVGISLAEGRISAALTACRRRIPNAYPTDSERMKARKSAKLTDITDSILHLVHTTLRCGISARGLRVLNEAPAHCPQSRQQGFQGDAR
jgi:hypothetical protein